MSFTPCYIDDSVFTGSGDRLGYAVMGDDENDWWAISFRQSAEGAPVATGCASRQEALDAVVADYLS